MVERNDKEQEGESGEPGNQHPVERVSGILDGIADVDQYIEEIRGGHTSTGRGRQTGTALDTIHALGDEICSRGTK